MSTVYITAPSGLLESQPNPVDDVDNEDISSTKALYVPSPSSSISNSIIGIDEDNISLTKEVIYVPSPTSISNRRRSARARTREDMLNKMWKRRASSGSGVGDSCGGTNWVQSIEVFGRDITSLVAISVLSNNTSSSPSSSDRKNNANSNNNSSVEFSEDLMGELSFDEEGSNDDDVDSHDDGDNETIYTTKTNIN